MSKDVKYGEINGSPEDISVLRRLIKNTIAEISRIDQNEFSIKRVPTWDNYYADEKFPVYSFIWDRLIMATEEDIDMDSRSDFYLNGFLLAQQYCRNKSDFDRMLFPIKKCCPNCGEML